MQVNSNDNINLKKSLDFKAFLLCNVNIVVKRLEGENLKETLRNLWKIIL